MGGPLDPKLLSAESERMNQVLRPLQALMSGVRVPVELPTTNQPVGLGPAIMVVFDPGSDAQSGQSS